MLQAVNLACRPVINCLLRSTYHALLHAALVHGSSAPMQQIAPCCAGAPICINTVLWNTIKLLFPKHAANAPESPADAILTPSAASTAALVANAVAALPMRRGGNGNIFGPFHPPRSVPATC